MIALAVVFVAVGLGVASAGIYASRSIVATANAAALEVGEPATVHGGVVHRALEPLLDQAARLMRALSPAARLDLIGRRIVYNGRNHVGFKQSTLDRFLTWASSIR